MRALRLLAFLLIPAAAAAIAAAPYEAPAKAVDPAIHVELILNSPSQTGQMQAIGYQGSAVCFKQEGKLVSALTCAHLFEGGSLVYMDVHSRKLSSRFAYLSKIDRQKDLAEIKFYCNEAAPCAKIAKAEVEEGEMAIQVGFGMGVMRQRTGPRMPFWDFYEQKNKWSWIFDFRSVGGDSGSGVYNTDCEITGILWGKHTGLDMALVIPLSDIKAFLEAK